MPVSPEFWIWGCPKSGSIHITVTSPLAFVNKRSGYEINGFALLAASLAVGFSRQKIEPVAWWPAACQHFSCASTVELITATSPQRPMFLADSQCIDCCLTLSTTATFVCPKVAFEERFNCRFSLRFFLKLS